MYFNHSSYNEERVLQKALQFSLQEAEAEEKKRSKEQQDNLSNKTSKSKKINTIKKRSIKKTLINERKMSSLKKSIQKSEQDVKIKAKAGAAVVKRPVGRPRIVQNRSPVRDKSASEETETEEEAVDKTEVARTAEDKGEEEPPITYKFTATRKFPCNYSKLGNDDPQQSVEASGSLKGGKKCAKNDDPEGSNDICILGTSDVSTGDFLNFLCFRDVSLLSLNRKRKQGIY